MKSKYAVQHLLLREHFLKEISEGVLFFVRCDFCNVVKSIKKGFEAMISEKTKSYYDLKKRNEVQESAKRLRRQFLRYKDAEIVYSMQHRKLLELASEAGAIYRMDGTVLINRDIFDEYLERFHEPSTLAPQEEEK